MNQVLLYCRQGFENECAGEVQDKANKLELFGFPRAKKNTGYVLFEFYQAGMLISSCNYSRFRS